MRVNVFRVSVADTRGDHPRVEKGPQYRPWNEVRDWLLENAPEHTEAIESVDPWQFAHKHPPVHALRLDDGRRLRCFAEGPRKLYSVWIADEDGNVLEQGPSRVLLADASEWALLRLRQSRVEGGPWSRQHDFLERALDEGGDEQSLVGCGAAVLFGGHLEFQVAKTSEP